MARIKTSKDFLLKIAIVALVLLLGFLFLQKAESKSQKPEALFCGGIEGTSCPDGYMCEYVSDSPDAGGQCVKDF